MFDDFEVVLGRYLKIILDDLEYAKNDPQYYDNETLKKVCKVRDGLSVAYKAAAELNAAAGKVNQ